MASAEARTTALLFSFSAVVFLLLARAVLLQPPQQRRRGALGDVLLAALDRFLDGRGGLLELATRTNMILLCNAILLVILRDAGVLGAPARRRGASPGAGAATATTSAARASAPPKHRTRSVVVWRRPRDRAAAVYDAGRLVNHQLRRGPRPAEAAAPWDTPALTGPAQMEDPLTNKQIVLVDKATTNHLLYDYDHDRADVVQLEPAAASATDGRSNFDRRIIVVDGETTTKTVREQTEEMELADDRRIEEFIAKQWSMMRQESLQLGRSGSQQAITTC